MANAYLAFADAVLKANTKENNMAKSPKKIPATLKEETPTYIKVALRDKSDMIVTVIDEKMEAENSLPTIYIHMQKAYQFCSLSSEVATYREVSSKSSSEFDMLSMYITPNNKVILSNDDDESTALHHEFSLNEVKIKRFRLYESFDIAIQVDQPNLSIKS